MRVLVAGATGLLGSAMFRLLAADPSLDTTGTLRTPARATAFPAAMRERLVPVDGLESLDSLAALLEQTAPDVVINCLGAPKAEWAEFERLIALFSLVPRRLGQLCARRGIRLIHISSDGVFSGRTGDYAEDDIPDATDPYGIAKQLGEVEGPHAVTLRTSMIGHSLGGGSGLVDWLLGQSGTCRGYSGAIFSGLPTVVLAQIVRDVILPGPALNGIFHVAAAPISKFELLRLIAARYGKDIDIVADIGHAKNLSLSPLKFQRTTGYTAPPWPDLIDAMYRDHASNAVQHVQG